MNRKNYIFYLALLYFVVNIITIIVYRNHFGNQGDETRYIHSAITLLKEHKLVYENSSSTVFIMPGLPFLLSFIMYFFGSGAVGLFVFRFIQCLLQVGILLLVYKISATLFSKKIANISATFLVFYIPNYTLSGVALTEIPFNFFLLLLSYFTILAIESKKVKHYLFIGVFWALTSYFRPTVCLFPIIIFVLWKTNHYTIKEVIRFSVIIFSTFVVLMSPWWIRNGVEFHKFIPFTDSSGNPFFYGAEPFYKEPPKEFVKQNPDYINFKDVATSFEINNLPNANKRMLTLGFSLYKYEFFNDPVNLLVWILIGKPIILYAYPFYAINIYHIPFLIVFLIHWFYLLLGIVGFFTSRSKGIVRLVVIYLTLIYLPLFTYFRYSYPTMIFVTMLSAIGIAALAHKLNKILCRL